MYPSYQTKYQVTAKRAFNITNKALNRPQMLINAANAIIAIPSKLRAAFRLSVKAPQVQSDLPHGFTKFVNSLGQMDMDEQCEAIGGITKSWQEILPGQMDRVANQLCLLTKQDWFSHRHAFTLSSVAEKLCYYAYQFNNKKALKQVQQAMAFDQVLSAAARRGVIKAQKEEAAAMPSSKVA